MVASRFGWWFVAKAPCPTRAADASPPQNGNSCAPLLFCNWLKCIADGCVSECMSLEDRPPAATAPTHADDITTSFERNVSAANVARLLTPAGEDDLRSEEHTSE